MKDTRLRPFDYGCILIMLVLLYLIPAQCSMAYDASQYNASEHFFMEGTR